MATLVRRSVIALTAVGVALGALGLCAAQAPAAAGPGAAEPAAALRASTGPVRAQHAMVVTIHHDATDAGVAILHAGGNAVDAAVAVGFALAVVYPQAGNIGGGGFMLIRPGTTRLNHGKPTFLDYREKAPAAASANMYLDAKGDVVPKMSTFGGIMLIRPGTTRLNHGKPTFLDYREKAPAAASANMYLDAKGDVVPKMSTFGGKASGVPGTVAGLVYAERHFGKLGLAAVLQPAIRLARDGYVLDAPVAMAMRTPQLTPFAASRRIFQRDGQFYEPGETFRQPELARTLERIAADPDGFYKGKMAAEIAAFEKANDGQITAEDLAAYECKQRTPLLGHYRGLDVLTSPPPSSGGIVLIEALNILSGYDLAKLGPDRSPAQIHVIVEAFRRAYMDRGDYLGDPDFNTMPLAQMADPVYAAAWRRTIDPVNPSPSKTLVRPAGFMPDVTMVTSSGHESNETTQFSVVDAQGNAVSSTYTLNFYFGSGVTVDGLGFVLNDEMDDFTSKVGVPNAFGLVQGPANAIGPGKRPLSSMTPTIVSEPAAAARPGTGKRKARAVAKLGKLRLVLGSPGGSTIITTVANDLISVVDNGLDIQEAADAPRFHHQYLPDILQFEKVFPTAPIDALKAIGYITAQQSEFDEKTPGVWGDSELIAVDPKTGQLLGGHDNRRTFGKAAGY